MKSEDVSIESQKILKRKKKDKNVDGPIGQGLFLCISKSNY